MKSVMECRGGVPCDVFDDVGFSKIWCAHEFGFVFQDCEEFLGNVICVFNKPVRGGWRFWQEIVG